MTDHIDTAQEREKLAGLQGHTPGPWTHHKCLCGHRACNQHTISTQGGVGFRAEDARLIAAAPNLRDMVTTLADELEAERAKVAEIERLRKADEYDADAAKGMTSEVDLGDGAWATIIDPRSFEDGGAEWVMRYGNPRSIRFVVASLLESYDGLLSSDITSREAVRRLRLLRKAYAALTGEAAP